MGKVIDFNLSKQQLDIIDELEKNESELELKLASGSDIVDCPLCRGGGCYGSCQMSGC